MRTPPTPTHDCGMCDGSLRFNGYDGGFATFVCTECGQWHIAKDCCEHSLQSRRRPEPRMPDEILADFDDIQHRYIPTSVDRHGTPVEANLRDLLWEVINDMLDSLKGYEEWDFDTPGFDLLPEGAAAVVQECHSMLTDYVTNHYGDD